MRVLMLCICLICLTKLSGQTTSMFKPFPGDSAEMYKFDLYKNFYADDNAEYRDREKLVRDFQKLKKDFTERSASGKNCYDLIVEFDSLIKRSGKHSAYLGMFAYIDLSNPAYYMKMDSFSQKVSPIVNSINETITALPRSSIINKNDNSHLPDYSFYYSQLQINPMRQLPPNERRIINDLTPALTNWQSQIFLTMMRTTQFKPVMTPNGIKNLPANLMELFNSTDRSLRKEAYQNNLDGIKSQREIYATLLLETVRNRNRIATLSGFKNYPEQYYAQRFLTSAEVNNLYRILKDSAYIFKRYETAVFENIKKIGHIDTVFAWDRFTPDPNAPTPRFTVGEATQIILDATRSLGNDYYTEMSKLLDPLNGRLDMVNRPNRILRPGFSNGSVGYNSVFFQGNYEGYMSDLIIFGHEAGHAVQNMLMDKNGVSSFYALGPGYFTESFAGFNELLITDYLYQKAISKDLKKYYLGKFLEQAVELFGNAMDETYEQILYDSIPAGKIGNADQLESQLQKTGREFSIWYEPHMKYEMQWVNEMQFVTNPLYRVNYVYSKLLALYYFSLYKQDGKSFTRKYNELLRNGYDQEPNKILNKFFGININDNKVIDLSLHLIKQKVEEYESLIN